MLFVFFMLMNQPRAIHVMPVLRPDLTRIERMPVLKPDLRLVERMPVLKPPRP